MCLPLLLRCLLNHWCRPHCLDCVALCPNLEGFLPPVLLIEKKHRDQYKNPIMPQRRVKQYTRETFLKWKATCQCFVGSSHHQASLRDCNAKHVHWHQMLPVSVEHIVVVDVMFAPSESRVLGGSHNSGVEDVSMGCVTTSPMWAKGNFWKTSMCLSIIPPTCSLLYKQRISACGRFSNPGNGVSER